MEMALGKVWHLGHSVAPDTAALVPWKSIILYRLLASIGFDLSVACVT